MQLTAVVVLLGLGSGLTVLKGAEHQLYVSPAGDDSGPGTLARPFRSLTKARDAVRAVNRNMVSDIVIYLRGATHVLDETLVLDARDSGSGGHTVVYRNYPGEKPLVSGGRRIKGWQRETANRWRAPAGLKDFRQLYVNGTRAIRARGGPLPGAQPIGLTGYKTSDRSMAKWKNPTDIELVFDVVWERTICKVAAIKEDASGAVLTMLQPYFTLARMKEGVRVELPAFVQNAFELLDEPGEWYLDKSASAVYYIPRAGEDMATAEVIAPALERLVEFRGTLDEPVHDLRFEGITFSHATWLQPGETGHIDIQANFTMSQQNLFLRTGTTRQGRGPAYLSGEGVKSPSNITLHAAHRVRFERCRFTRLGGGGVDIEAGSHDNVISGCVFDDISGSAIQVGDVTDHHPADPRAVVGNNQVVNNYIHEVANEYLAGVGIFVGYTDGTRVAHNEISHLPYSGVSIGWGWGEPDAGGGAYWQPSTYPTATVARNNICEHNHIHHVMQRLNDGGAIYTLGNMAGSVIRGNHIHGSIGFPGGIYLDEGSGFIEVAGNLIYNLQGFEQRKPRPLNFNNRAQNRLATCKVHDNYVDVKPGDAGFPQAVVDEAGLEPKYRDLLTAGR